MSPRKASVGVFPARAASRRPRLLAALELAFPVRFEAREEGAWGELDALLCFGAEDEARRAAASGVRCLSVPSAGDPDDRSPASLDAGAVGGAAAVALAGSPVMDRRLRGRTLPDHAAHRAAPLSAPDGFAALALRGNDVLWARDASGRLDLAALAPAELAEVDSLRGRLVPGCFLGLLPLLELLREITAPLAFEPPPSRAAFLVDDPNLHWPSYGFLSLPDLVRHAREHGYHAALAMVPLDGWFAHPGAVELLASNPEQVSLLVHGNDHRRNELGRPSGEPEALAVAAQALRRIEAFEARHGLSVSRVMAPPHEACSEPMAAGLLRCGFEAISMTRPYPWLSQHPRGWLTGPPGRQSLTGWDPAEFVAGGLPVLLRHPIVDRSSAEVALRAYLDQPLILYGHHADLVGGFEALAEAAAEIATLGEVHWGSLETISRSNYASRREGTTLRVRLYSRRVRVDVPAGVERVVVENGQCGDAVPVTGPCELEVRLPSSGTLDPAQVPRMRTHPWPLARRLAGEGRDRLLPLLPGPGATR